MHLTGNTVLITGGGSGIGFELASRLTLLGNSVIVTGRNPAKLEEAKARIPSLRTFVSDVGDPAAIASLHAEILAAAPETNVLVNNAGVMRRTNLNDPVEDLADLTHEIEINFSGTVRMVSQFLPHLASQPSAAILNVSSGLAYVPLPISPIYCATKAAIHSYTQSLRVQLAKTTVKVFELLPPATKTELLDTFPAGDFEGVTAMAVEKMVDAAIEGLQTDRFEIAPGQSSQLRLMGRVAPRFILKQLSRPVESMLAGS